MDSSFLTSLQHMCAVKIATHLFFDADIDKILEEERNQPDLISYYSFTQRPKYEAWSLVEEIAEEKLPPSLPPLLRTRVAKFIRPLHWDFQRWLFDHRDFDILFTDSSWRRTSLTWMTNGTLNREETARKLVRDENLDLSFRFTLACLYFLEEELLSLWQNHKAVLYDDEQYDYEAEIFCKDWLMYGVDKPFNEVICHFLETATLNLMPVPLGKLFRFLPTEKRLPIFFDCDLVLSEHEYHSCLREMSESEREAVFSREPLKRLYRCLIWPFQNQFLDVATTVKDQLNYYHFYEILKLLVNYILLGFQDFGFVEILKEFWRLSPDFLKEQIKEQKIFIPIETVLNYEAGKQSLSLQETLDRKLYKTKNNPETEVEKELEK